MSNQTATVLVAAIALLGFYLLVGNIVHQTGTTAGVADIIRDFARVHLLTYQSKPVDHWLTGGPPCLMWAAKLRI